MRFFEVSGTHYHQGVFELYLEKKAPRFLSFIFALGPIRARAVGMLMLLFSFFFSTSKAPHRFIMESGWAANPFEAAKIQSIVGYTIFGLAFLFYLLVFFFRKERMDLVFDKSSKSLSVDREPLFRFNPRKRAVLKFENIQKVQKLSPQEMPEAPHGLVRILSKNTSADFAALEFKVLTDEQFEFFPLNIEKILGT